MDTNQTQNDNHESPHAHLHRLSTMEILMRVLAVAAALSAIGLISEMARQSLMH